MLSKSIAVSFILLGFACGSQSSDTAVPSKRNTDTKTSTQLLVSDNKDYKVIHVFVALCDNKYQGIVPVPAAIGNGQNANTNLYWGAANGVKSYFKKSSDWELVRSLMHPAENIIERVLFRHKYSKTYLVADAYDGQFIQQTTIDFLNAAAGNNNVLIVNNNDSLFAGGSSDLIAYVGHDGLMDFELNEKFSNSSDKKRETIILACYSKHYFSSHLRSTGASPLLWTNGLMAPEAYTLHDAIAGWIKEKPVRDTRLAAAKAYSKYQKCSVKAATNLISTGW